MYRFFGQAIYTGYGLIVVGRGVCKHSLAEVLLATWLVALLLFGQAGAEDYAPEKPGVRG